MLYNNNVSFRPICWFLQPQRHMAFLYVMISLTEQCNRHTVHYSLVGKQSMLCVLLVCEGHSQPLWCCLSFPHCSFFRGHSLIDGSKRHLDICSLFIWKHGSVLEQYQAVIFDVHSLRLDLFKSLLLGSEAPAEMGFALQVSVSLCL